DRQFERQVSPPARACADRPGASGFPGRFGTSGARVSSDRKDHLLASAKPIPAPGGRAPGRDRQAGFACETDAGQFEAKWPVLRDGGAGLSYRRRGAAGARKLVLTTIDIAMRVSIVSRSSFGGGQCGLSRLSCLRFDGTMRLHPRALRFMPLL